MINKKSLWFLTLFSLILVLSVYYITMPSELLLTTNNIKDKKEETVTKEENESAQLVALRVEAEEDMLKSIEELKAVLTSSKSTTEEKNNAFNKMQELNKNKGLEDNIEKKLKTDLNLTAFVKIDGSNISVVIDKKDGDKSLANKVMRNVQSNFDESKNISVKFQK